MIACWATSTACPNWLCILQYFTALNQWSLLMVPPSDPAGPVPRTEETGARRRRVRASAADAPWALAVRNTSGTIDSKADNFRTGIEYAAWRYLRDLCQVVLLGQTSWVHRRLFFQTPHDRCVNFSSFIKHRRTTFIAEDSRLSPSELCTQTLAGKEFLTSATILRHCSGYNGSGTLKCLNYLAIVVKR